MLIAGQTIGPIRLLAPLGVGGMGEVWEGLDENLGRKVAVKAIGHGQGGDGAARTRFAREARILSQIEHPNICRLYEFLHVGELNVLILELVRGRPLGRAIAEGLADSQRLTIALGVGAALQAAHAVSVVHRDLKPDNVMLAEDGSVKVLDFGIARRESAPESDRAREEPFPEAAVADEPAPERLTLAGEVVGTPRYMSPEQARGEPATAASDMFCFGLLLFELYTRQVPYGTGGYLETLERAQWETSRRWPASIGRSRR